VSHHQVDALNTDFMYLNPRLPPFNDVRVRRAINYAVDRKELVRLYGHGDGYALPTCQMLPPRFPSYSRYCPYQSGPPDGPYLGPDFPKALQLVRDSGTTGTRIVIHALQGQSLWSAYPAYFASVLTRLGYAVTFEPIPASSAPGYPDDPAYAAYQIFTQQGWNADYPAPSNFYSVLFACHQPNLSGYCNRTIEARAQQAAALAATEPNAALAAWTTVDKLLTDDAAFVALGNRWHNQLVSERVGNYVGQPVSGAILSQLWVR